MHPFTKLCEEYLAMNITVLEEPPVLSRQNAYGNQEWNNIGKWRKGPSRYLVKVFLKNNSKIFIESEYTQGAAFIDKPRIDHVMSSLLSDASLGHMMFKDFCDECGHDFDSRKALDIYLKCQEIYSQVRQMFAGTGSLYQQFEKAREEF